jgi:Flp pilus assembly protein TadB
MTKLILLIVLLFIFIFMSLISSISWIGGVGRIHSKALNEISSLGKAYERIGVIRLLEKRVLAAVDSLTPKLEWTASLRYEIERMSIPVDARKIIAQKIMYPIASILSGIFVSYLFSDIKSVSIFFMGVSCIAAINSFFMPDYEIEKLKRKRREAVIMELPRFVRTIRYSPESKSLNDIIRDYLKIAKEGLYKDLKILLAELELNIPFERALMGFSERLVIQEVRELSSIIISSHTGDKKSAYTSLIFVENKLMEKAKRMARKKLSRRPDIVDTINDILLYSLGLIFLIPMGISMMESFGFMTR